MEALGSLSQFRLDHNDYTPARWTIRKEDRGQALFMGSHFSTTEVCLKLSITEMGVVRHTNNPCT